MFYVVRTPIVWMMHLNNNRMSALSVQQCNAGIQQYQLSYLFKVMR